MWIVYLALRRPYTFVVASILVVLLGVFAIFRMPTDIFPNVNIPVVAVIWQYTGMAPDEIEKRMVWPFERVLTTTVNDIEHIESQSLTGTGVVKIFFQPGAKIEQATAQVTAVSQTVLRQMPQGVQPPLIIQYSASNVPIIQLSISSDTLAEQAMFDLAQNVIRTQLITVPGAQIPWPYGGKQRQVVVDLDPDRLAAFGISPADVSTAINNQNVIVPGGSTKIGTQEYPVLTNSSPRTVSDLNDLPIRTVTNPDGTRTTVYIRDVASVRDGFQVQTNVVHTDGKRGVLISVMKNGGASTLDVVQGVLDKLPSIQASLPPYARDLKITPLFDQSIFVRASIEGVVHEAAIAAALTALMILLFLGSWRSTLIVIVSIPLSILVSIIILALLGETLNTMTLGGMALAVGILVDDATVAIENIHRNLHQRKTLVQAIIDGSAQIAVPAFVATICICIVFVPVVFITGAAKFLFTPLAMAVVFAMLTSYVLSRTLVPTMVHYLLAAEVEMYGGKVDANDPLEAAVSHVPWYRRKGFLLATGVGLILLVSGVVYGVRNGQVAAAWVWAAQNPRELITYGLWALLIAGVVAVSAKYQMVWRVHAVFNRVFEAIRHVYARALATALTLRWVTVAAFALMVGISIPLLWAHLGRDFFPSVDAGLIRLHVRAPAGTRIEETERYFAQVQQIIREKIPASQIKVALDNIGIPNSGINLALSDGTVNSPADGEILIALNEGHAPTEGYLKEIRSEVARRLPSLTIWAAPADISTQVLNFGLPAQVDVQIAGPLQNLEKNRQLAQAMYQDLMTVPGVVDPRMQQVVSTPDLRVNVDRTLAGQVGVTQRDVASDLLISLSSSSQTAPNFWLNPENGVNYSIVVQTPQYRVESLQDLTNTPVVATVGGATASLDNTQLLGNLAEVTRAVSPTNITHYNIQPTVDVLVSVQGTDLHSVQKGVEQVLAKYESQLPKGSRFVLRGQIESMQASFAGLALGLIFAVVLVYLLMVVNFQSWTDPLIIMMAVPGAAAGILWMLWATQTTISVPALMGAMMTVGVATANSILMVTFANDQRRDHGMSAVQAALSAGMTRLRPVIMTATAMIIGMLPMSLGLGEGGEQNAPLGRAVIGGLLMATLFTLVFVPVVYSILRQRAPKAVVLQELR